MCSQNLASPVRRVLTEEIPRGEPETKPPIRTLKVKLALVVSQFLAVCLQGRPPRQPLRRAASTLAFDREIPPRRPMAARYFVEDAMAGYFEEVHHLRDTLDRRYDDLKNGRVKPIPGDEVEAYFRDKSAAARRSPPRS
jgi:hypothetical protein